MSEAEPLLICSDEEIGKNVSGNNRRLLRSRTSPSCREDVTCPPGVVKSVDLLPFAPKEETSAILKAALIALVMYLAAGVALFYSSSSHLQGHKTSTLVDALYFCIVTMTTVGYGDLVPATASAKLLTCLYLFLGFGLVGVLLSSAANYLVIRQEDFVLKAMCKKHTVAAQRGSADTTSIVEVYWKVILTGVVVLAVMGLGVVVLTTVEGKSLLDSVYFVCVTCTTLGYGDHSFQTWQGRLFGSVWILVSTLCVAQFFLALTEMQTEVRQQRLANWVLTRQTTVSDLEAADLDKDGKVRAMEFVVFKLKELGKIDQSDVLQILKEFRQLDRDNSGALSVSDIVNKA